MKKICIILAAIMLIGSMFTLASCKKTDSGGDTTDGDALKRSLDDVDLHDIVKAVDDVLPYDGLVGGFTYKEDDVDELAYTLYYLWDADCFEKITDYVYTSPTDYNQTLAIFRFDDTATEDDINEVKNVVNEGYISGRVSALQMYFPEQYKIVSWQYEHQDAIWRTYDHTLVLVMYNDSEATAAWDAIDALLK